MEHIMTLKQDLLDRIIIDAAKHSAAVEAAAADLEAVEALAARLQASGSGPAHDWRTIATPHPEHVSIALINYRLITAAEAAAALAAAGLEATPAEPTYPGYANDHSQAFDLAGHSFQAIVQNPVAALLKAA